MKGIALEAEKPNALLQRLLPPRLLALYEYPTLGLLDFLWHVTGEEGLRKRKISPVVFALGLVGGTAHLLMGPLAVALTNGVGIYLLLPPFIPEEQTVTLPGRVRLILVRIPAGTFTMGSPDSEQGRSSREGPQHSVTLTQDFWLGKYPVTQAQWQAVMGNNPSYFKGAQNPVEQVSWDDAQAFITALNAHIRETDQGPATFRLPSEAEWEYACRAGTTTRFYWGDDPNASQIDAYAWYIGNGGNATTHPVGQKHPNAWGLYDMSGNVWEWCQDWYGKYSSGAVTDPTGPHSGSFRVLRGGSWDYDPEYCRSADRFNLTPDIRNYYYGFRVVRTP